MKNKWLSISSAFALSCYVFRSNHRLQISFYQISSCQVKTSFRIISISDTHIPYSGFRLSRLLTEVEQLNADLILLTGDIVDRTARQDDLKYAYEFVFKLMDIAPVVGVLGNHEEHLQLDYPHLLDNESIFLQIKDNPIEIYGVSPTHPVYPDDSNQTLRLVLDHYPKSFENYTDTYVFSGHAHGGQFRFIDQGLFAPDQGFLPKYTKGFYQMNENSGLFVSAGLGPSIIPLRLNNPNHLIVVDFI